MNRHVSSLYLVIFVLEVVWMAIVPLAPQLADELSLSAVETGAILGAGGVATLLVALPMGLLTDRLGARRITIASAWLLVLSTLGQGLAVDFWSLLAARGAFGIALGTMWTSGLAWLTARGNGAGSAVALGGTMTVAGAGLVVGPGFAGLLGDHFGLSTPFYVLAAVAFLATLDLMRSHGLAETPPVPREPVRELARRGRDRFLVAGFVLMIVVGLVNGSVNLLVPLQLEANGLSPGTIGLVISSASAVFVAVSVVVTRMGGRAMSLGLAAWGALVYGLLLAVPVVSVATAAVVVFVVLRSPAWGVVSTLSFPFGSHGAERARIGQGTIMGLLNVVWGASNTVGPLLAGAVTDAAGDPRWGYVPAVLVSLAAGWWLAYGSTVGGNRERRSRAVTSM